MVSSVESSPLGHQTVYVSQYDAGLLFPIARAESRKTLPIKADFLFNGVDLWTGYEISWLNEKGKPQVAVAEFIFSCRSPFITESKSFKLYLNSFNQTKFASIADVQATMEADLTQASGAPVLVKLLTVENSTLLIDFTFKAISIDDLDVVVDQYHPDAKLLKVDKRGSVAEVLCSHLLKSNCPVTGQPDWASLFIDYAGPQISHESLLKYIVSFREHQDFHEHCVERIFIDILQKCKPERLSVYARYTRRGGLDINPLRTTEKDFSVSIGRLLRQ